MTHEQQIETIGRAAIEILELCKQPGILPVPVEDVLADVETEVLLILSVMITGVTDEIKAQGAYSHTANTLGNGALSVLCDRLEQWPGVTEQELAQTKGRYLKRYSHEEAAGIMLRNLLRTAKGVSEAKTELNISQN